MYPPGLLGLAFEIISIVLRLFSIVLIVYVVISWLYAFDVVSRRNAFVASVWEFTRRISDPVLRPLRRIIPPIAGVDLSVMILLLIVWLLQSNVLPWLYLLLTGRGSIL
jgi:YggT family protein